ncbi:hypothetical protein KI387_012829 [Taxus chinensis]|uniref:GDSL esterase/lipase n=1 Tax=Taxus chinensis TaxID=29808 RepID=A0AA38CKF1_TAXCH|nr:hypothetical protein KI387_012829 [Taxus chinensis]
MRRNYNFQGICVGVLWVLIILLAREEDADADPNADGLALKSMPASFIFGDSLTDVGTNNHLTYCFAKSNFPWYGIDYNGGIPTGRFTNGRTIPDIIFEKLGLPNPQAYLSMSADDDAVLKGANYASGGAGILNETGFLFIDRVSFDKQIHEFEVTKQRLNNKVGEQAAQKFLNEAIYFVLIGSNDYINNYLLPVPTNAQQYDPHQFVDLLITSLQRQLKRIYEIGARKIVFNGMGPLGCIPSQRRQNPAGDGSCIEDVNTWARKFNVKIKTLLRQLNSQLPEVKITYVDTYALLMELIQNHRKYGFEVWDAPCCKVDTTFGQFCLPNSSLCKDRSKYVFWDAFHPSDAANEVMARLVLSHPDFLQFTPPPAPAPAPAPWNF